MSVTRWFAIAAIAFVVVSSPPGRARADVSDALQKKLKGKLYLAAEPFQLDGGDDAEVQKRLDQHARAILPHASEADGVASWSLAFVAFLSKKPGVTELSLDFFTDDKEALYVANKRLTGVARDLTLLTSALEINEDDGLTRGKSYVVKLTASIKSKDVVLASTKLTLK